MKSQTDCCIIVHYQIVKNENEERFLEKFNATLKKDQLFIEYVAEFIGTPSVIKLVHRPIS